MTFCYEEREPTSCIVVHNKWWTKINLHSWDLPKRFELLWIFKSEEMKRKVDDVMS